MSDRIPELKQLELKSQLREVKSQVCEVKSQVCEVKSQVSEVKSQVCEVKSQLREVKSQLREVKSQPCEVKSQLCEVKPPDRERSLEDCDLADLATPHHVHLQNQFPALPPRRHHLGGVVEGGGAGGGDGLDGEVLTLWSGAKFHLAGAEFNPPLLIRARTRVQRTFQSISEPQMTNIYFSVPFR